MIRTPAQILREHLRLLSSAEYSIDEGDLLGRYQRGDPTAFASLVHRHGPMVYGVCRRVLGRSPDADDAFQATFLALVRNPFAIRNPQALPAWLHRVALRTARKALTRRKPVRPADDGSTSREPEPVEQAVWADVRRALDEELNRLPSRFLAPLVLCYLDGVARDEAAARLRLTIGTLDRRLSAGRALLRSRLARRGLGAVALGTVVFSGGLAVAVPEHLSGSTAELACAGRLVSTEVQALLSRSATFRVPAFAGIALLGALVATVIGAAGWSGGDEPTRPKPAPPMATKVNEEPAEPLPEGAVARMGSTKLRHVGLSDFAFTEGGKTIVSLGVDPAVRYWDPVSGRQSNNCAAFEPCRCSSESDPGRRGRC
jgi:RNA polymerase sigma factor (sigma-70 family)